MAKFEVAIHNEDVRNCVKAGRKHHALSSDWADTHYIEIDARNDMEARSKIARRYPSSQGYIIEDVISSKFDD